MLCSVLCLCKQTRNPSFFAFEVLGTAYDEERRSVAWIMLCMLLLVGNEVFLPAMPSFLSLFGVTKVCLYLNSRFCTVLASEKSSDTNTIDIWNFFITSFYAGALNS